MKRGIFLSTRTRTLLLIRMQCNVQAHSQTQHTDWQTRTQPAASSFVRQATIMVVQHARAIKRVAVVFSFSETTTFILFRGRQLPWSRHANARLTAEAHSARSSWLPAQPLCNCLYISYFRLYLRTFCARTLQN